MYNKFLLQSFFYIGFNIALCFISNVIKSLIPIQLNMLKI